MMDPKIFGYRRQFNMFQCITFISSLKGCLTNRPLTNRPLDQSSVDQPSFDETGFHMSLILCVLSSSAVQGWLLHLHSTLLRRLGQFLHPIPPLLLLSLLLLLLLFCTPGGLICGSCKTSP